MSAINVSIQDNSTAISIVQNAAIAAVSHYTVNIVLSCCSGGGTITPEQVFDALNTLDEYANMESAIADGRGLHDMYWASEATDSLIAGGLYRVTSV